MAGLQSLFGFILIACLSYLLVDGFRSGSVWVKGHSKRVRISNAWASKIERSQAPVTFWGFMAFYAAGFFFSVYHLAQINGLL